MLKIVVPMSEQMEVLKKLNKSFIQRYNLCLKLDGLRKKNNNLTNF